MIPLNSAIEEEFTKYLKGLDITNLGTNVYRFFNGVDAVTPCVFVIANQKGSVIGTAESGIYRVPFEVRVVYVAQQVYQDANAIDTLTEDVEEALASSQSAINADETSNLHVFSLTMTSTPNPEVVDHTFQYVISLEAVCKKKQPI